MKKKKSSAPPGPRPRKRRRRRRGPGILISLLCLVLICAAILAAVTVFFKVKRVTVSGESQYSAEEVLQAAGIAEGENLFFLNKVAITNRIFRDRPYLDTVSIRRKFPDTVEIVLKDCVPSAVVSYENRYWLVDKKGKILEEIIDFLGEYAETLEAMEQKQIEKLGLLLALEDPQVGEYLDFSQQEQGKALSTILNTAENSGILKEIMGIDMTKLFEIRLQYTERFVVELGTVEELEKKISFLNQVVERLGSTDTGVIDLTDPQTARFRPQ